VEPLRKNIGQLDFLFRIRRTRLQPFLSRVEHDPRSAHIGVSDPGQDPVAQQTEEPVIKSRDIDID
jgi:hypothetical protein